MAVSYKIGPGLRKKIMGKAIGRLGGKKMVNLCTKAGKPTDNTDLAIENSDLCWDSTNNDVYCASAVTGSTTTWTKIVD